MCVMSFSKMPKKNIVYKAKINANNATMYDIDATEGIFKQ